METKTKEILMPAFKLTIEEMAAILAITRSPNILGLPNPLFGTMDEEKIKTLLSAGERSLIARDFLSYPTEEEIQFNPILLTVVGPVIMPDLSLIITSYPSEGAPIIEYFQRSRSLYVKRMSVAEGVYLFEGIKDAEAFLSAIHQRLDLPVCDDTYLNYATTVPADFFEIINKLIKEPMEEKLLSYFNDIGLSEDRFMLLSRDLRDGVRSISIIFLRHGKDSLVSKGLSLWIAPSRIWMAEPILKNETEMNFGLYTGKEMKNMIEAILTTAETMNS
ncbi:MAG: hypothetical protein CL609_10705 [Anaerolineaceae bacterium]|nr:hypothetical protein [Anaerolineaceae bacterium]